MTTELPIRGMLWKDIVWGIYLIGARRLFPIKICLSNEQTKKYT